MEENHEKEDFGNTGGCCFIFALSPPQVYAQSVESIHYDDGSYILIEKECSSQKRRRLVLKVAVNSINIIRRLTNCNG